jgi:hypothetical protein
MQLHGKEIANFAVSLAKHTYITCAYHADILDMACGRPSKRSNARKIINLGLGVKIVSS